MVFLKLSTKIELSKIVYMLQLTEEILMWKGENLKLRLPKDFKYKVGDPISEGDLLLLAAEKLGNEVLPILKPLLGPDLDSMKKMKERTWNELKRF